MTYTVFTFVPFYFRRPKTWISALVRNLGKRKSPSSHVCYLTNKQYDPDLKMWHDTEEWWIVESDIGGVVCIPYDEWAAKRKGNWIDCYLTPDDHIDWVSFSLAYGKPYDYWDAISHKLNNKKAFIKKKYRKWTCSKLSTFLNTRYQVVAKRLGLADWFAALPQDHQRMCEEMDYPLDKRIVD